MCASTPEQGTHLAAVDLGSNSFHLVVAEQREGELVLLDRIRERIGLAEGLTENGPMVEEVAERALKCLRRFGERLSDIPPRQVRCVGTAAFRDVNDGRSFLTRAEESLGHEIETLPGKEEARLIYLGVAHSLGDDSAGRLVIDIGGGSTEIILGRQFESKEGSSLPLGCVYQSGRFFDGGELNRNAFRKAILAARLEIAPVAESLLGSKWKQCIGASGTVTSVAEVLCQNYGGDGTITSSGLDALINDLCEMGHVQEIALAGLREDRKGVVAGGLSILRALFDELELEVMGTAKGALREGLLYDLMGRLHHEDVRHRSVSALARRFSVDESHADAVRQTAGSLFDQVRKSWSLKRRHKRLLDWAVDLAEVGMAVSFSGYHQHGAYLVANADMPGFSSERRDLLAGLVRLHRRRTRSDAFESLPKAARNKMLRIAAILRIAHRLNRTRSASAPPEVQAKADGALLGLEFAPGWLDASPLIQEDLLQEAQHLLLWDIRLEFC